MIEKIDIRNIATFDDSGIEISDLKKVNFIYGVNGSGKTTISKFIHEPDKDLFKDCNLKWKNDTPVKTLVYNKDFRDRNFGKGTIDGVFTLGQATKEEAEEIENKQQDLKELKAKGVQKKETIEAQTKKKEELEEEFREEVWQALYKKHELNFKEAFKGYLQKRTFLTRLLQEYESNSADIKTHEELIEKAKTIFGKTPENLSPIQVIDFSTLTEIELKGIWNKKIIGKSDIDIAKLIQKLNINDWINEGRKYIQEGIDTCPFCQQPTITNDFKKQLEDYFDESFMADTKLVSENSEEYLRVSENILNELQIIEQNEKVNQNSKLDIDKYSSRLRTIESQFSTNKEIISNKIKEPSRDFTLKNTSEQLQEIVTIVVNANKEIKKHNEIVENFTTEKAKLISQVWRYLIEDFKVSIQNFVKNYNGLQKGLESLAKDREKLLQDYLKLDKEVKELTKNITSIQPSIDEINKTLKSFGFKNFEIVPSKIGVNQYQIQREDGELAESTLSEGEVTFITFLYFLQLAKGSTDETTITDDRVLIIDDPISSLDSNVLFVVSTLVKEIIKTVKAESSNIYQVILFTHNVYFHKEVSFIDGRTKECGKTNYWILRRLDQTSTIQNYETKNPIQNSYELLWRELKDRDDRSCITIQNTMRRIVENYFKILGKYGDDDLINKFENPQEKEICRSLISWINEGSHTIPDDLFVEQQDDVIEIYFEVFKSIFKETGHLEHYNMMMN
ncbi:AAA family ATPase [uncultured Draconibacterium sp.]|uniref:AAA family ATPase n=1 Tax=uncultured Draconibacterium sp. TaxID=1573823 RepID=UPI002AA65085|nr:AAA family ATPase [uncultured Draconibacterium sp.]